ncbi:FAD-dependent monooxygenase [Hyalangium versicolor]|uniref:FAD-dependent monooxygenase n=1 Tax=Hyalangium versicolor TaxID=2861190 RepID=UPI001CCB393D|nr:FAD-dependent monooxygenase [Hyalangium versicolor]
MRVLVSGGGIAGLALAFWLERLGIETVVAERAREFKPLGHYIALKGNGVRVIRRMGLIEACRAREAPIDSLRYVTSTGRLLREDSTASLDRELGGLIAFRRADLHAALHEAISGKVELRLGTEVEESETAGERVEVRFRGGRTETFDLLVGADGVHSPTRERVFGKGLEVPFGGHYVALTLEYDHGLELQCGVAYLGRGQMVIFLPMSPRVVSLVVYHGEVGQWPESREPGALRAFLLREYRHFAAPVSRAFEAIDERGYVFTDVITQVRMPHVVKGRVALLGDAGGCPTFLSGMGSALAIQGADLLARAIAEHRSDVPRALASYEAAIQPLNARYQESAGKMRGFVLGRSRVRAAVRDAALAWMPDGFMIRQARRFYDAENATAALT